MRETLSVTVENLRGNARMRAETDKEMSVAWMILPIAPVIIGVSIWVAIFAFTSSISITSFNSTSTGGLTPGAIGSLLALAVVIILLGILGLAFAILNAVMIYKLVKRRNSHFGRQLLLYQHLYDALREIGGRKNVDVSIPLNNLDRTMREVRIEETPKSSGLWAVLVFLPIIGFFASWYVYYFSMRDFYRHERREDLYINDLLGALAVSGVNISLPRRMYPIPDRSFALYLILSIITLRLFDIYWVYVLLTDPNNHFRQQWMVEDTFIAQLSPLLGGPSQPAYPTYPPSPPPPQYIPPASTPIPPAPSPSSADQPFTSPPPPP